MGEMVNGRYESNARLRPGYKFVPTCDCCKWFDEKYCEHPDYPPMKEDEAECKKCDLWEEE